MRRFVLSLAAITAAGLLTAPASLQEREVVGSSPYDVVENWMKPFAAAGYAWGSHPGVFAESPDRIFVIQRGEFRLPDPVPPGFAGFVYWETMRHLPVATVSVIMYIEPATAVLWAAAFLDEDPNLATWLGVALVVVGGAVAASSAADTEPLGAPAVL